LLARKNAREQPSDRFSTGTGTAIFFTFREEARRLSSGSRSASTAAWSLSLRHFFRRLLPEPPTPEKCVGAYYLQRTRFESIAQRKLRRRQLTEKGNVEISGRDLREGFLSPPVGERPWR
jgi:hypothetical protein